MKRLLGAALLAAGLLAPASAQVAANGSSNASGQLQFAPMAMASLIEKLCRKAEDDGADLVALAKASGLGAPRDPPYDLRRALPESAQVWSAPSADGEVFLFGYGERPLSCGAAVLRPMPVVGFDRALAQFQANGFKVDAAETMSGSTRSTRLKAGNGQYVDLMEYPPAESSPGVLRADLLPN
jgi:hypothetical protein